MRSQQLSAFTPTIRRTFIALPSKHHQAYPQDLCRPASHPTHYHLESSELRIALIPEHIVVSLIYDLDHLY